jgi:ATP-dependent helicase HrpB
MKTVAIDLPIQEVLPDIKEKLQAHDELILEAPPGAGKTTLVPLALLDQKWLGNRKILILEPRRIATRSAAHRMAELISEQAGQTVGYRMRLDTMTSDKTRIEVITEGILTRMLQDDPSLEKVGLVIFDEFHERSLDSDLALALCLKGREMFRGDNPLKILIMSATLDTKQLQQLLSAPVISSEGQQYPVDIVYGKASQPRERIVDRVVAATLKALSDNPDSSLLVFLPGQGEIRRTYDGLQAQLRGQDRSTILLKPLYGNLSIEEQREVIRPLSKPGLRKVVLATNIAETSLTIDGVDIVVDSGLVREPLFDPNTAMTRLQTRRISRPSSVQRAGRAGRLGPGKCYRLWSQGQQQQMASQITPDIINADLAPLALQLLRWGVNDPKELSWLDVPPKGAWKQALELLHDLGALEMSGNLTRHGHVLTNLPVHPRLGHMLVRGAQADYLETATFLAAVLSDRDPFSQDEPDILHRVELLTGARECPPGHKGWLERTGRLAQQFRSDEALRGIEVDIRVPSDQVLGYLIACAYPDRIARQRHSGGYQLANGRSAEFQRNHRLGRSSWLAVAEVGGMAGSKGDIIRSAACLDSALFDDHLSELVVEDKVVEWDAQKNRFIAESKRCIGALILSRQRLDDISAEVRQQALVNFVVNKGLNLLPWSPAIRQWQARVELARTHAGGFPEVSDEHLTTTLSEWLLPYLTGITRLEDFKKLDLEGILKSLLTWEQSKQLDELVPERLQVPSGSAIKLDYTHNPPVLAPKLQEMFGCESTPTILNGRVAVLIHLLSPAGRPLQVTQDLAGFWKNAYQEVKKEMKGRYPKHPWPDDPVSAAATRKVKSG